MSIAQFDPFCPKRIEYYSTCRQVIQEVIYYAESRFHVILNEISKSDLRRKIWMESLLLRELVCTPAVRLSFFLLFKNDI